MTATRSQPSPAEIARALYCIRDVRDPAARRVAHLVDLQQAARRGGNRDALCGRPGSRWRPTDEVPGLTEFQVCPDCADINEAAIHDQTTPPPDPRPAPGLGLPERGATPLGAGTPALAGPTPSGLGQGRPSAPRHDPIACTPAPPREANTQAARVAHRVAFRESWAPASGGYIPAEDTRRPQGARLTGRFTT